MAARHRRSRHLDVQRAQQPGQGPVAQGLRRLDRAHRQGRSAAGAAASERRRAQHRRHVVGRRRRSLVHARRGLDRQESSDRERRRQRVRRVGRPRPAGRARSRTKTRPSPSTSRRARPKEKVPSRFPAPNRPSLHWGNEHLWANPPYDPADPHNPMLDSKGRVWMTSKIRSNQDPSWCSERHQQVRRLVPAAEQRPPGVVLRSEDQAVHADRHLLLHAPSAVRQRPRRDRVLQRTGRPDRSAGSTPRSTTRPRTSRKPTAGAARCSTPTATARSPAVERRPTGGGELGALPGRHRGRRRRSGRARRGRRPSTPSSTRWSATACTP